MTLESYQNSEQIAGDKIDQLLILAGWAVQSKKKVNLNESKGIAVRDYQTDVGPTEYVEALRQSILKKAFEGSILTEAEIEKRKQQADYEPASVLLDRIKNEKVIRYACR